MWGRGRLVGGSVLPMTLVQRFTLALAVIALAVATTVLTAARVPYLGLGLNANEAGQVTVGAVDGRPSPAAGPRSVLIRIAPSGAGSETGIEPGALDLIDEPDTLDYAGYDRFVERQGRIAVMLAAGSVDLTVVAPSGGERVLRGEAAPWRPVSALPFAFWYQIACGVIIAVIGAWVQSLSPRDGKVKLFALAGYGVCLSVFSASIYSTRELALAEPLFRTLTILNNIGAMTFGVGMIGLFTVYPKKLPVGRLGWYLAGFFALWTASTHLRLSPSLGLNGMGYLGILAEMLVIIGLIVAQYAATRYDLPARRALTWLGMTVIVGAGAFVLLIAVPSLLGVDVALPQGYAFGFFVLIYLGVALGLTRYRLFELDRWAFSVFSYVLAAFLFAATDFALVGALALTPAASLGISAVLVGLVYLPLRNLLLQRYAERRDPDPYDLFRASTEIALQTSDAARAARWRDALLAHFRPLHVEESGCAGDRPQIEREGDVLVVPAQPWSPTLRLFHRREGRGLFGPPHCALVEDFANLVAAAEEQRLAYDRGVREERSRIGRDLHDSVGARLISSLRACDDGDARQMVHHALGDIREIVGGLSDRREPLANIVAELRAETMERMSDVAVDWPLSQADRSELVLAYAVFRNFTSIHRELVTNAIKHAPGASLKISTDITAGMLRHRVVNRLAAAETPATRAFSGNGLDNLAVRAGQAGGRFDYTVEDGRFIAGLELPVVPATEAAA